MVSYVSEKVIKGQIKGDSKAYGEWKKNYKEFLQKLLEGKITGKGPYYQDPDKNNGKTHAAFCEALTIFLNAREDECMDKLSGRYYYKCKELGRYKQIAVYDKPERQEPCFYLKSDQFGFSAPSGNKNHPYDVYLQRVKKEKKNIKDVIENVANWIYESRTMGGAFLWPMELNKKNKWNTNPSYNYVRGNYLSDRVDLTLVEIKHIYDVKEKEDKEIANGDFLYNRYKKNMKSWLDHFDNFNTFCEFFCFQDFVYKVDDEHIPYDITKDWKEKKYCLESYLEIRDAQTKKNCRKVMENEFWNQDAEDWEQTLSFVNERIKRRTKAMEEIIAKNSKENTAEMCETNAK
jgi:hypothetical protein